MKKIIFVLVVVVLSGCNMIYSAKDGYYNDLLNFELYEVNFGVLDGKEQYTSMWISSFLNEKIKYQSENTNTCTGFEETLSLGYGDCEEFAIAFLNILKVEKGIEGNIVLVYSPDSRTIINNGKINHCIIELPNGTLIEPQNGLTVQYEVKYRYLFDEIFN